MFAVLLFSLLVVGVASAIDNETGAYILRIVVKQRQVWKENLTYIIPVQMGMMVIVLG